MKIVDLSQYRKKKEQKANDSGQSNEDKRSFDEKLKDLIYKPFSENDSAKDLIAIFEEEQLRKDNENDEA
jgi:hypothetical protein